MKPIKVCVRRKSGEGRSSHLFVIPKIALQTANQLLIETLQGSGPTLSAIGREFGLSARDLAARITAHVPAYLTDVDLEDLLKLAFPEANRV